ncbi:MAG: polyprenyl synthetase family protein [Herpetosiphon sp.]
MSQPLTERVTAVMRSALPVNSDPAIADFYAHMEYHLGWRDTEWQAITTEGGKRIRPLLAVLACRALGGTVAHALPLAAALQLLHDFSLIHDDIEDHSTLRRGRPTLWSLRGMEVSINVGDGMFALAHQALHGLSDAGVDPVTTLEVLRSFEQTILLICEGQHLDITAEGRFDITTARYLTMIGRKTAALLAASASLGARLATSDSAQVTAMYNAGWSLGMAFQVQDDLLDIWGDPAVTGKPAAADLLQRKLSLPVLYALEHAAPVDRDAWQTIYRQASLTASDVERLLAILDRTAARAAVDRIADQYHVEAQQYLHAVTPADPVSWAELNQLCDRLLRRSH